MKPAGTLAGLSSTRTSRAIGLRRDERALRAGQRVLARSREHAILFDEAEDAFGDAYSGFLALFGAAPIRTGRSKGWTNRVLEEAPLPTLWTANRVDGFDAALLRRFDFVLEMDVPPRSVRRGIAQKHAGGLGVRPAWLDALAEEPDIAPAVIERAARTVRRAIGCSVPALGCGYSASGRSNPARSLSVLGLA